MSRRTVDNFAVMGTRGLCHTETFEFTILYYWETIENFDIKTKLNMSPFIEYHWMRFFLETFQVIIDVNVIIHNSCDHETTKGTQRVCLIWAGIGSSCFINTEKCVNSRKLIYKCRTIPWPFIYLFVCGVLVLGACNAVGEWFNLQLVLCHLWCKIRPQTKRKKKHIIFGWPAKLIICGKYFYFIIYFNIPLRRAPLLLKIGSQIMVNDLEVGQGLNVGDVRIGLSPATHFLLPNVFTL